MMRVGGSFEHRDFEDEMCAVSPRSAPDCAAS